jgi:hypothetical protein
MGAVPPPPPDAKEDPRAAAGKRISYHDMDLVAEVCILFSIIVYDFGSESRMLYRVTSN